MACGESAKKPNLLGSHYCVCVGWVVPAEKFPSPIWLYLYAGFGRLAGWQAGLAGAQVGKWAGGKAGKSGKVAGGRWQVCRAVCCPFLSRAPPPHPNCSLV